MCSGTGIVFTVTVLQGKRYKVPITCPDCDGTGQK
jgi:hypothetical protein